MILVEVCCTKRRIQRLGRMTSTGRRGKIDENVSRFYIRVAGKKVTYADRWGPTLEHARAIVDKLGGKLKLPPYILK